ncbi:hypothetical protein FOA52_005317 [Chlamydomonas sp. UWO 241]|nr:hypothetical protein FOA52_005317 [Chlamydomonas sp. UWO 241]
MAVKLYDSADGAQCVVVHDTPGAAAATLANIVVDASEAAIAARGAFTLVLSGGSLPGTLSAMATLSQPVQWDRFHIFFVDERVVPHASPDSTLRAAREALLDRVTIPGDQLSPDSNLRAAREVLLDRVPVSGDQVHAILEGASGAAAAADDYAAQLAALPARVLPRDASTGLPVFDLLLLGVGPDGHVASLFPGHATLSQGQGQQQQQQHADGAAPGPLPPGHHASSGSSGAWVLPVTDSPKPPPQRITMSLPVINAAVRAVFVALGEGKAEIVARCLEPPPGAPQLPAQMVLPATGTQWLLDTASAQRLSLSSAWRPCC